MNRQTRGWLSLAPSLVMIGVTCLFGFVLALQSSFADKGSLVTHYIALFTDATFLSSFLFTLWLTLVSTVLSIAIGWGLCRLVYRRLQNRLSKLVMWVPMMFPHFVWAYMVYLLLQPSGILSVSLLDLGVISSREAFPLVVQDPFGIGIIISYVWKEVPFVVLMLLPVYLEMDARYQEQAALLGASRWRIFKVAELPFVVPTLIEISVILFSFIFVGYEVPALLGSSEQKAMGVLLFDWFYGGNIADRPLGFALAVSLTVCVTAVAGTVFYHTRKVRQRLVNRV